MPNTLPRSVSASAGMRSAAAAATASSSRTMPSTIEYSLCRRRWMKPTELRELAELMDVTEEVTEDVTEGVTELTEPGAIMMYNFTRFDSSLRHLGEIRKSLPRPRACAGRIHRRRLRERASGQYSAGGATRCARRSERAPAAGQAPGAADDESQSRIQD